jgi:hypothetical protein
MSAGKVDSRHHISGVGTAGNQGRAAVNHPVPHGSRFVVSFIAGADEFPVQLGGKCLNFGFIESGRFFPHFGHRFS